MQRTDNSNLRKAIVREAFKPEHSVGNAIFSLKQLRHPENAIRALGVRGRRLEWEAEREHRETLNHIDEIAEKHNEIFDLLIQKIITDGSHGARIDQLRKAADSLSMAERISGAAGIASSGLHSNAEVRIAAKITTGSYDLKQRSNEFSKLGDEVSSIMHGVRELGHGGFLINRVGDLISGRMGPRKFLSEVKEELFDWGRDIRLSLRD
ncbi:Uncharacterised protein [Candidatus Anstonella stagnisolia]|nr:Uncharacterised protein [Candidatus Anstonella stagnisolia]